MIYVSPPNWLIIYFSVYQACLCILYSILLPLFWKIAIVYIVIFFFTEVLLLVQILMHSTKIRYVYLWESISTPSLSSWIMHNIFFFLCEYLLKCHMLSQNLYFSHHCSLANLLLSLLHLVGLNISV